MNKQCIICSNDGIYKCPTCLIYYCSVTCCKKHRENNCEVLKPKIDISEGIDSSLKKTVGNSEIYTDEVSHEKLSKLGSSDELKNLLQNPHLQNLLLAVDSTENADEIMQKAMQEPLFVEFADACLKVVEPDVTQTDSTPMT